VKARKTKTVQHSEEQSWMIVEFYKTLPERLGQWVQHAVTGRLMQSVGLNRQCWRKNMMMNFSQNEFLSLGGILHVIYISCR
jgi:hypothetical protein